MRYNPATALAAIAVLASLAAWSACAQTTAAIPTPELEPMALEAGIWDAVVTFPPATPGAPPTIMKAVQDNALRSNGSWVINLFDIEGGAYSGSGFWGWDAATRRYVGVWGDTNEHRLRQDIGYWNAAQHTMVWHSDLVRPDGMVTPMKMVSTYDGDHRTFDIFSVGYKTGAETLLVHMDFTRRAVAPESP